MILGVIQASNRSKRLPGKASMKILGKPMLELMLERVKRAMGVEKWVIATTDHSDDDAVALIAEGFGVDCHRARGKTLFSKKNVLRQFHDIAKKYKANCIVRLTGDCPLADPGIISRVVWQYIMNRNAVDYVSNCWYRSFPRGMDVEIVSIFALEKILGSRRHEPGLPTITDFDREHVTTIFRRYPRIFPGIDVQPVNGAFENGEPASEMFDARLTVDYPEDFEVVNAIFKGLYKKNPEFGLIDIKLFLDNNPKILAMNAHIIQEG